MPKYTEFDILPGGNLRISLTEEGKQERDDIQSGKFYAGDYKRDIGYWTEYQLGNGWEFLRPEEIGALTDAPILAENVKRREDGEYIGVAWVFWYPDYAIRNPVDVLLRDGSVEFRRGD